MAIIPTDLLDRIRTLERQIRDLMGSANTNPALNEIMGGEVVIGDGGRLRVRTAGGEDLLYLGRVEPDRKPDVPQQGLVVRRDDGSLALTVWTGSPDTLPTQPVQILDRKGNVVVADDAAHHGLARPYIPYPLPEPVDTARWESTGATDWATLYRGPGIAQHPRLYCRIGVQGTAGAQIRVLVNGSPLGPVATTPEPELVFTEPLTAEFGATVTFEVQAKVATAGDTVRCRPLALYGVQS
ncbi:hypothetical protein M5362_22130 [Streptomyces sp. Je 1-79]|uniref:hypothetical protein n=1 Tax=Streptomyces sp. Je 1-79 TaxID=2943847 RepID=UPI0021A54DBA|nr:hypothetical protein [Streptomyces sp. Je 1-79]MCT4355842.1 hypothetical protein [Streptomyces sp. Je 1-79]